MLPGFVTAHFIPLFLASLRQCVLLCLVATAAFAQYRFDSWTTDNGLPHNSIWALRQTLKIENLEIFYRDAGDPNKPTVLLLHGFPTSSHTGHFALEEEGDRIVRLIQGFLAKQQIR